MIRFDCHAHVYETVVAVDGARYVPATPAPLAGWLDHGRRHGLAGGVIVQVSFLGTDNSEMVRALARLDPRRFAGVAVVPLDVDGAQLDRLAAAGVRGVRWNLVRGAPVPDLASPGTHAFLGRLAERGLHLELHLESPRLAGVVPALLDRGQTVVVDHFGLPRDPDPRSDPWLAAIRARADLDRLFVKFAAPYRTRFDIAPHAGAILDLLPPDRIVWGSDWPHTQHEQEADYDAVARLRDRHGLADDAGAVALLYGLAAG